MYKKLLSVIVVLGLFAGCQSNTTANPDDVLKMTQNQERRIGVLQSLGGAYTSTQATHLLRMEDGKNIYLKSDVVALDDEKYINKEVEVMGQILRTTDGKQVITVNSIDIIDAETGTDEDLPQWLDYESDQLALNIKYRDDYRLSESNLEIVITKQPVKEEVLDPENVEPDLLSDMQMAAITLKKLSSDPDELAGLMKVESLDGADILAGGFTRSKVTQKAIDAYKKADSSDNEIYYYLKINSGVYLISFTPGDNIDDLVAEQNMFYDILASVDFRGDAIISEEVVSDKDLSDDGLVVEIKKVEIPDDEDVVAEDDAEDTAMEESDDSINAESQGGELTGFSTFTSESAGFSIQYPKSYYFGSASLTSGASRSYEFGSQPLEESPGDILLDIMKGDVPEGKSSSYGGVSMTTVNNGDLASVYAEIGGKVYKLTGPANKEGMLKQMASTIAN